MALIEMNIKSVVVSAGPMPSLVVLQPKENDGSLPSTLPINIGAFEATAISIGVQPAGISRPMTHDLLVSLMKEVGAEFSEVRIVKVHGTTFFAQVIATAQDGTTHAVDARPSDAIALAVRTDMPIYAEQEVLLTASLPDFSTVETTQREQDIASFHSFVEELSPEDFNTE